MPLTEEKETLTVWMGWSNDYMENPSETKVVPAMEELTNVHIEYQVAGTTEASEKFGLMVAGGEYPDIIVGAHQYYTGGIEKGIEDGIFLDMTDLVQNYMPTYLALAETNEEARKAIRSDNGRYPMVYTFSGNNDSIQGQKVFIGPAVRKDWLDELGLEIPETIEDWHTVLTAFKEKKGADAPMMIRNDGTMIWGAFMTAYGIGSEWYVDNGTVKFAPAEEGYRQYLETIHQWYEEGLIDKDFAGNTYPIMLPDYAATGRSGGGSLLYTFGGNMYYTSGYTDDENINYVATPFPVLKKGDKPISDAVSNPIANSVAITVNCKNPELAARWLDYQYTEDAMLMNAYGIEGDSYILAEDGTITYTDNIMNNPDGYSPSDALNFYTTHTTAFGKMNWQTEEVLFGEENYAMQDIWEAADKSLCYPSNTSMTTEEGITYNSLYTTIETLVDETTVKYILGTESLDNFDQYVEILYQYGLQDCLDIKQAAYDRYMSR